METRSEDAKILRAQLPSDLLEPTFREFYFRFRLDAIIFKKPKTKSILFCFVS